MNRKEQAAASRSELVEAARFCFGHRGYDATTVAAILERTGMARGALYHYFPGGKAEIFSAVFELINEDFHRRRDAPLALSSPVARLRAGVAVFLEMCIEDDFARIALTDAPRVVPGQSDRGIPMRSCGSRSPEQCAPGIATGRHRCHGHGPVRGGAQCR